MEIEVLKASGKTRTDTQDSVNDVKKMYMNMEVESSAKSNRKRRVRPAGKSKKSD